MHVTFDIDGVLADFSKGHCGVLKDLYGLDIDPRACKAWHWADWVDGLTKEMEDKAWDAIFSDPKYATFWRDLDPLCTEQDIKRINDLAHRNIVSFVTTRAASGQHENVVVDTQGWLRDRRLHPWPNTYLTGSGGKGARAQLLGTHIAIDDNGDNCVDLLDHGVGAVLLKRAYNESFVDLIKTRGGYIVDSLEEFLVMCVQFDERQNGPPGK